MEGQVTREELATLVVLLAHRGGFRIKTDRLEGILPADILAAVREWNEAVVALLAMEEDCRDQQGAAGPPAGYAADGLTGMRRKFYFVAKNF